jgi:hypothetical protein
MNAAEQVIERQLFGLYPFAGVSIGNVNFFRPESIQKRVTRQVVASAAVDPSNPQTHDDNYGVFRLSYDIRNVRKLLTIKTFMNRCLCPLMKLGTMIASYSKHMTSPP